MGKMLMIRTSLILAPTGQETWIVIVPHPVGELTQIRAVHPGAEDVVGALRAEVMVQCAFVFGHLRLGAVLVIIRGVVGHAMLGFGESEQDWSRRQSPGLAR